MSLMKWPRAAMLTCFLAAIFSHTVLAQASVVRAVLFYSPTCPHCHIVMEEHLPPLKAQYGDRLEILEVNVQTSAGNRVYEAYLSDYSVPPERQGVPALVVADTYMVGSVEIPTYFPGLIEQGLAGGGLDWPALPGLDAVLNSSNQEQAPGLGERFAQDAIGNSIALIVLIGMASSVLLVGYAVWSKKVALRKWPVWVAPLLVIVGLIAASYLTYIEWTHNEAFCGPVGDCNAVQASPYAYIFGVIPVASLGLFGFLAIGITWFISVRGATENRPTAIKAAWWMALAGTLFSLYLTYLEPFVIGATCAWCLTSAVAMTSLLWAATPEMVESRRARGRRGIRKLSARRA